MKSPALIILCLAASSAFAAPQNALGGLLGILQGGYGKVADVPGAGPRRIPMESRYPQIPGAKTLKIRYGPYKVPNVSKKSVGGESGKLFNYPDTGVEKPCSDCILLGVGAGLEYPNGTEATTPDGMWLHHMVAFTVGERRMDPTCVGKLSLPHMLIGSDASRAERFYSAGNERSQARFNPPWVTNAVMGYSLYPTDKFSFIVDLMNQNKDDKVVYMTMTYDYVEGRPKGIDDVKAIWLDAAQCGTSEIRAPQQDGSYSVKYNWTANIEGEVIGAGGHLHDGGSHLTLNVDGKLVCDAVAKYGDEKEGSKDGMAGGPMMGGMAGHDSSPNTSSNKQEHITSMTACHDDTLGLKQIKKGQKWQLEAFYDYSKHPGMLGTNGKQTNVMGISIVYIKNPKM